jgi:hypothetical protein
MCSENQKQFRKLLNETEINEDIDFTSEQLEPFDVYYVLHDIFNFNTIVGEKRMGIYEYNNIPPIISLSTEDLKNTTLGKYMKEYKVYNESTKEWSSKGYDLSRAEFAYIRIQRMMEDDVKDNLNVRVVENIDGLELKSIVCHVDGAHYITYIKCNGEWYKYDDTENDLEKIGSFEELYDNENVGEICTDLYYFR